MKKRYCLLTNDVETGSVWFNTLSDETAARVLKEGMPILLDIYSRYNIKSTFFFTAYIAKLFPEIVKMILKDGHEVASHGKSHLPENGFDVMSYKKQKSHLSYSKKLLEDISGQEVISFRAPALRVSRFTAQALLETGYKIDSSVASQRFDFFLSFGSWTKFNWFFSSRLPYKVDPNNIFKKGSSDLVEIPLTAFLIPYISTTMRIFPHITSIQRIIFNFEGNIRNKPVVFNIHPNEFIDESGEKRYINRRCNGIINYLLKDYLKAHIKTKNLGMRTIPIYNKEIEFYKTRRYNFCTIQEYCKTNGLI